MLLPSYSSKMKTEDCAEMLVPILHPLWKRGLNTSFSDAYVMVSLESHQVVFNTYATFVRRLEVIRGIYQLNYMSYIDIL